MYKKTIFLGITLLAICATILAACSAPGTPVAPTVDANAIYTQAAATVSAGLAMTQAALPSSTPTTAPTQTLAPTATQAVALPTLDINASGTQTALTPSATPLISLTKVAPPPAKSPDKAEWVSQSPADKTKIQKGSTFTATFVMKNTGTTTWNKTYTMRYYAGDKMEAPNDLNMTKEVKPGDTIQFTFQMRAPNTVKDTNTVFVLSNPDGANFYSFYINLSITE